MLSVKILFAVLTCISYYETLVIGNWTPCGTSNSTRCKTYCNLYKKGAIDRNANINTYNFEPSMGRLVRRCDTNHSMDTDPCRRTEHRHRCVQEELLNTYNTDFNSCRDIKRNIDKNKYRLLFPLILYNQSLACFNRCMLQRGRFIDGLDKVVFDKFRGYNTENISIGSVISTCTQSNSHKDVCTRAVRRINCISEAVFEVDKKVIEYLPILNLV